MEKLTGLSALLPHEFVAGKNDLIIIGWRMMNEGGIRKYSLLLEDGRECKQMQANALLQDIAAFEQKNANNNMPATNGMSMKYARPVQVKFTYVPKSSGGRSFDSNYQDIVISLKTAPNPTVKPGA